MKLAIRTIATATLAAAVLTACTYDDRDRPYPRAGNNIPAVRVTGPDQSCIPLTHFNETRVRDGRTIDFLSPTGHRGWRNVLPQSCPGLGFERAFSYKTSLSQLCSTDIIYVLERTGGDLRPGAGCGLGSFTPIELIRR